MKRETVFLIGMSLQGILLLAAIYFMIKSAYHYHQADRICEHKGKQTFWQWIRHIDTPRGTGIWK